VHVFVTTKFKLNRNPLTLHCPTKTKHNNHTFCQKWVMSEIGSLSLICPLTDRLGWTIHRFIENFEAISSVPVFHLMYLLHFAFVGWFTGKWEHFVREMCKGEVYLLACFHWNVVEAIVMFFTPSTATTNWHRFIHESRKS